MNDARVEIGSILPCHRVGNTCLFANGMSVSFSEDEMKRVLSIPTLTGRYLVDERFADLYEKLKELGILRKLEVPNYRIGVVVKVTKGCTLNCRYCYEWASPEAINKRLTIETFDNLVKKVLSRHKYAEVQFHGGEPFIYFDDFIKKVLEKYGHKDKDEGVWWFEAQSNGTLFASESFTKRVVETWKRLAGRPRIGISIDGLERDNWLRVLPNGENSWHIVVQGIKNLVKYTGDVGTITVVNKRAVGHLPKIAEFLMDLGVVASRFNILYPAGHEDIVKYAPDPDEYVDGLIALAKWRIRKAEEEPERQYLVKTISEYMASLMGASMSVCGPSPCGAGVHFFALNYDGTLLPCDHAPDELALGNVNDPDFKLYSRENIEKLINLHSTSGRRRIDGPCASCPYRGICQNGGCPMFLLEMYGWEYYKHKYFCPKRLYDFLLRILDEGDMCKITALMEGKPRC